MTGSGEKAIEDAKKNGMWDNSPSGSITDEQIAAFAERLTGISPAYDNFIKQSRSAKVANYGGICRSRVRSCAAGIWKK